MYKADRVASHEGAWLAGTDGARFGLMMPGLPLVGSLYYQEIAPGVAMDRAEIVALAETLGTPAGEFRGVLKVSETNPLQLIRSREYKYYVRNIGLAQDGSFKLVKHGMNVDPGKPISWPRADPMQAPLRPRKLLERRRIVILPSYALL
jgi:hypothetical protein